MLDTAEESRLSTARPVVKSRAFAAWDWPIFAGLTVAGAIVIAVFFSRWFAVGWGQHPLVYLVTTGLLAVILVNQQGRWFLLLPMRHPRPMPVARGLRVAVVTTYVPGAESAEMIEASLKAMVAIDYPHDTWLLDEGDDDDIKARCRQLGVQHFSRRNRAEHQAAEGTFRSGSKHGNYNAWLHEVGFDRYDYLVAFDPDHMPLPHYIDETLGFFRDPEVGYVQVAQAYYNQRSSLVARGAAEETYAFFSAVQMASYGLDYPIIVGGHNSHRMSALKEVGGLAAHDADDLLLTLRYRAAGWEGVYLPRILARGLTPVDWRGYLVQQRRWARSVLDLKLRHRDQYAGALSLPTRIMSLLHGLNFLHRSLAYLGAVCVLLYLLATRQTLAVLSHQMLAPGVGMIGVLGLQELYRQRFYLDWRGEAGPHWRAGLLGFAKWPWFLLALIDAVSRRRTAYTITWKTPRGGPYRPFVAWNLVLPALVAACWTIGRLQGSVDPLLTVCAAVVVVLSVGLAISALRPPPPPFTSGLWQPGVPHTRPPIRSAAAAR